MAPRGRKGAWGLSWLCRGTEDGLRFVWEGGQRGEDQHLRGYQGGTLPELRTCRAEGRTSLVVASTAMGQVKQEGAELTLLV